MMSNGKERRFSTRVRHPSWIVEISRIFILDFLDFQFFITAQPGTVPYCCVPCDIPSDCCSCLSCLVPLTQP